ncbi:hypothetical protein [Streptomyces sp. NPDC088794]|uniref:hypothetical protein n=1 Tax=Streptomyces sp. NPDC088794 TaxID=3365902 RepID=UPI0038047BC5
MAIETARAGGRWPVAGGRWHKAMGGRFLKPGDTVYDACPEAVDHTARGPRGDRDSTRRSKSYM